MAVDFSQPVDQQALNLTHAIALQESSKDGKTPEYNAVGDNGTSKGAYQWQPGNYEAAAKNAGLDPTDFSPANQDKVAYAQIKAYKDKGYDPGQIASLWNSGSPDNWQNHSGTTVINGKTISYDTPKYVNGVKQHYLALTGNQEAGQQVGQQPQQTETGIKSTQDESLTSQLVNRVNEGTKALSDIATPQSAGGQSLVSDVLQTGGAIGGAIGDITNKALELIPGVKGIENLIGQGVGALAQTDAGQSVTKAVRAFSDQHPELSKDIGAAFNIVTAIPILKGLGVVKNLAMDATATALKDVAEKGMVNSLTEAAASVKSGRNLLNKTPDAIREMVEARAIPEIQGGKYVTKTAYDTLDNTISHIEEGELQTTLAKADKMTGASQSFTGVTKQALDYLKTEYKPSNSELGAVEKKLMDYTSSYGNNPTLKDLTEIKRKIRKGVNFNSSAIEHNTAYLAGQALQNNIEKVASRLGLDDVAAINQKMGRLMQAQEMLKVIDGRSVKTGIIGKALKGGAGMLGEAGGNAIGIPVSGALTGYSALGGIVNKFSPESLTESVLKRTGQNAVKTTANEIKSGAKGLISGSLLQKANR